MAKTTSLSALQAVVIAGGSGTRFWPRSRRHHPKQLLALSGNESLLHSTFARVGALVPWEHCWMVVGAAHAQGCRTAVPHLPHAQVLVEPSARNTAPAIGLAALAVRRQRPGSVMLVLPADHFVADKEAFCRSLAVAERVARAGHIATLGIAPTHPETGYGYIEQGPGTTSVPGAFAVARFCEKPDRARAESFVADGRFLWNAGIFVMQPQVYLDEVRRQLPQLHAVLEQIDALVGRDRPDPDAFAESYEAAWRAAPSVSIDYGVMEGAQQAAVVPARCGWSDVGSWSALGALVAADASGNVVDGRAVAIDSRNCVLSATDGHMVGVLGVEGLAVVHTPDATLVVPIERAQQVRALIDGIGAHGWSEYL